MDIAFFRRKSRSAFSISAGGVFIVFFTKWLIRRNLLPVHAANMIRSLKGRSSHNSLLIFFIYGSPSVAPCLARALI